MSEHAISEARARLADVVEEARATGAPVYLSRRGTRVAAVVSIETLERLQADTTPPVEQVTQWFERMDRVGASTTFLVEFPDGRVDHPDMPAQRVELP